MQKLSTALLSTAAGILTACGAAAIERTELDVSAKYPGEATHIRGSEAYPSYALAFRDAAGWKCLGSSGGNKLSVSETELPGRPGERGLKFSALINKRGESAPNFAGWLYALSPELNIEGADRVELDIYPLDELPFDIVARFGTQRGFGILPCTWSSVSQGLKPRRWSKVQIPIHRTRSSIDCFKFDFKTRQEAVPQGKETSFIITGVRFLPEPARGMAVYGGAMEVSKPLRAAYVESSEREELSGGDELKLSIEVESELDAPGVELRLRGPSYVLVGKADVKAPFSVFEISLKGAQAALGEGRLELELEIAAKDGAVLASGKEPFKVLCVGEPSMEAERGKLLARLDAALKRLGSLDGPKALPTATAAVAGLFLKSFIPDDFRRQKEYGRAMDELRDVGRLLSELESELDLRSSGKSPERRIAAYDPDEAVEAKGGKLLQRGKPILLIGPMNSLNPSSDWFDYAAPLGFNSVAAETNMGDWLLFDQGSKRPYSQRGELLLSETRSEGVQRLAQGYLRGAYERKLAANLLLSSHYCSELPKRFEPARGDGCGDGNFNWNVLAPEAKAAFEEMYGRLIPQVKKFPNLVSLGTANEPGYRVEASSQSFRTAFDEAMRAKHGRIELLNGAWGSSYPSFEAIDLASAFKLRQSSPAASIDWSQFESLQVNSFYKFLRDLLLAEMPGKQVWVKLMGKMGYAMLDEEDNVNLGQNVCGSDGSSDIWIDHLRSLRPDLPVTNQEWHFLSGETGNDPALLPNRMYVCVSRGLQSANIWKGSRTDWRSKSNGGEESFPRYPLGMNSICRASLKLRMLHPEISSFLSLDGGSIRLLYDKRAHLVQGDSYLRSVERAYATLKLNASGLRFIYPAGLKAGDLSKLKLIAVGGLELLPEDEAKLLCEWVEAGGTLWLSKPSRLSDYRGKPLDLPEGFLAAVGREGESAYGKGKVEAREDWDGAAAFLQRPCATSGGSLNRSIECRLARSDADGKWLLSIVNRSGEPQIFSLEKPEEPLPESWTDLWNGGAPELLQGEIRIPAYGVKLLKEAPPRASK